MISMLCSLFFVLFDLTLQRKDGLRELRNRIFERRFLVGKRQK
jgi:hypothetical protein